LTNAFYKVRASSADLARRVIEAALDVFGAVRFAWLDLQIDL